MNSFKLMELFSLTVTFFLILSQDAHAYLDPGTGSYVLQVLVAVFVGSFYAIKVYWIKIKAFFSKSKDGQDDSE